MKIFTSYHAKVKQLIEMGITPVSISVQFPRYSSIKYSQYLLLAPTYPMLKMSLEQYDIEFQKILGKLNPVTVHKDLANMSQGKDIALLCYEKDVNDCHRKQVAEWIFKKLQIKVEEIEFKAKDKKVEKIINQAYLGAIPVENFENTIKTISKYQKFANILNIGAAVHRMVEIANDTMEKAEFNPSEEWVSLSKVLGNVAVPVEDAINLGDTIKLMIENGEVDKSRKWESLRILVKNYMNNGTKE